MLIDNDMNPEYYPKLLKICSFSDKSEKNSNKEIIELDYLTKEDFDAHYMVISHEKRILQKFITPKDNNNNLIQVFWSHQFCTMTIFTNINSMLNKKATFHDKTCTFEGPPHLTQIRPINSPQISQQIKDCCDYINMRIQRLSNNSVQQSHLKLVFKLDNNNYPWLLFCSSVKVRDNNYINKQPKNTFGKEYNQKSQGIFEQTFKRAKRVEVPTEIEFSDKMLQNKKKIVTNLNQDTTGFGYCSNCQLKTSTLYNLPMKFIKDAYLKRVLTKCCDVKFNTLDGKKNDNRGHEEESSGECIKNLPAIFERIWGAIRKDKWDSLIKNPSWLNLEVKICEQCYILFTDCSYGVDGNFLINQKNKEKYSVTIVAKSTLDQEDLQNIGIGSQALSILHSKVNFDQANGIYSMDQNGDDKLQPLNNNPTLGIKDLKMSDNNERISADEFLDYNLEISPVRPNKGDLAEKEEKGLEQIESIEKVSPRELDESQVLAQNGTELQEVGTVNFKTDNEFVTDADNDFGSRTKDQTVHFDNDYYSQDSENYELKPKMEKPQGQFFNARSYDSGIAHQKETIQAVSFRKKNFMKKKDDKYSMEKFFVSSNKNNMRTEEFASTSDNNYFYPSKASTSRKMELKPKISKTYLEKGEHLDTYRSDKDLLNFDKVMRRNFGKKYNSNKKLVPIVQTERESTNHDDAAYKNTETYQSNSRFDLCVNSIKSQKNKYGNSMKGLTTRK